MSEPGVLQQFARRAADAARTLSEKCDLCSEPIPPQHRHLLESGTRSVACVCQACSVLFANPVASRGKYRLIPDRRLHLLDFSLTDTEWASLHVPVGLCFITTGRAYYPGPMGATEACVDPQIWAGLMARCQLLGEIEPDLEGLLVNRARGRHDYFIAPIDECFSLVGLIRTRWRGLSGGTLVWSEITDFFDALGRRSRPYSMEEARCQPATT